MVAADIIVVVVVAVGIAIYAVIALAGNLIEEFDDNQKHKHGDKYEPPNDN